MTTITRPRRGIQPPTGFTVTPYNQPCAECGQPACTTTLDGRYLHPGCMERRIERETSVPPGEDCPLSIGELLVAFDAEVVEVGWAR